MYRANDETKLVYVADAAWQRASGKSHNVTDSFLLSAMPDGCASMLSTVALLSAVRAFPSSC